MIGPGPRPPGALLERRVHVRTRILHFYRAPALDAAGLRSLRGRLPADLEARIGEIETEFCYNVEISDALDAEAEALLRWLLSETFEPDRFGPRSFLDGDVIEIGPRLNFTTAWSTNAVSILASCGIRGIRRLERSRRFRVTDRQGRPLTAELRRAFIDAASDRMTEMAYPEPLSSFRTGMKPEPVTVVPVLEEGRAALERINAEMGLGFDEADLDYYTRLFREDLGRNPTNVECFDMGQSNSEHSRHWFFQGRLVLDGREIPETLLDIVRATWRANPNNSVIAFRDNSSAIRGFDVPLLLPERPGGPSRFVETRRSYHLLFTAETHNFPTGVAPFPGAETGTGGRIRDVQGAGTGGLVVAGTTAYHVGNLRIPGYELPWEDPDFAYPPNLARPLAVEIEASNGASDYGNKFGEPVVQGSTRSFGLRLPSGERREWIKPIMFTGGVGQIDAAHVEKAPPEPGMLVVKIGGPAYRIGMGGGAASSMIQGENVAELDFNAVQRGDAEMEQKMNRVIRACAEMGPENPIVSLHDQGAGGNCNVVKELVHPAGGRIEIRDIPVGDETLSVLEIWGAEYQENNALLIRPESRELFDRLCRREKVPWAVIGRVTGDGRIVVRDRLDGSTPVDLDLEKVLGDMPRKTFVDRRDPPRLEPLRLPAGVDAAAVLDRVLRLLSVGSKRFLTSKVDRSVTGLVARQPCCGPLQLTVADVAVVAQSHFGATGAAVAIGEQPIKGLLDPAAMARMSVGEAVTNIVWALNTGLPDVRCSANWMWAAKLPGEAVRLHEAAVAMRDVMIALGMAVDGGKDSLSMAAKVRDAEGREETVRAPGTLVVSAYVSVPDVSRVVTPDLKAPGTGRLFLIDLAPGRARTGGSALAQVFGQIGDEAPDLEDPGLLARAYELVQGLIAEDRILSGHDRSDGGLAVALLEMAFSGNCGIEIDLPAAGGDRPPDDIALLFAEELGLLVEVSPEDAGLLRERAAGARVPLVELGRVLAEPVVRIRRAGRRILEDSMARLRDRWEETSFRLEAFQTDPEAAAEERRNVYERPGPTYHVPWKPEPTPAAWLETRDRPRVAVLREEGSNGDREMISAFHMAGFEVWDVTMTDLAEGRIRLPDFRGLVFVGGFSYADVLDSAKGWAGVIRFNPRLREEFEAFYGRPDTFSLGVCNGCQLMALLGWVPWAGVADPDRPRFVRNRSGRFESRFSTVRIEPGPAVMLEGMAGGVLGVWVAHGEGRLHFPEPAILDRVLAEGLAPLRYVDDAGRATEDYPFNPNGSPGGVTALCSPDGRHLAMMPHPERAVLKWQWAWMPGGLRRELRVSPWLTMFQNARRWCDRTG